MARTRIDLVKFQSRVNKLGENNKDVGGACAIILGVVE